jgi:sigma-B regulation protein RsbU (phosphoserine phosphatase)
MSKASSLYSCLSKTNLSPASLLTQLNNEICETISRGMFVTMLIGVYDKSTKELLLANAGHEPPVILNDKNEFSNFNEAGPPLGIIPKTPYKEYKIKFENSSMYIFTDGITEIKNPQGEELGSKGFQNYITKFKDKTNNERLKLIIDNVLGSKYVQKDDLTIVVLDS